MSPQRSDLVLPSNIPDGELDIFVLDSLNVEANGGDSGDNFAESGTSQCWFEPTEIASLLQLVEDGGLSSGIESNHQNSHLLFPHEPIEQLGKGESHDGSRVLGRALVTACRELVEIWLRFGSI